MPFVFGNMHNSIDFRGSFNIHDKQEKTLS